MIYFIIGTKAQLIKCAPVIVALEQRKIPYSYISTGQHNETMDDILSNFNIRKPDHYVYQGRDIVSVPQMLGWGIGVLWNVFRNKNKFFTNDPKNIVVVHGDTASTILGALIGRLLGMKVAHIESGLRSFDLFNPFPEELFRRIVFLLVDIYFCPGSIATENVKQFRGDKVDTVTNTVIDSLQLALKNEKTQQATAPYGLISLHRYENFSTIAAATKIVECLEKIAENNRCIFIMHKATEINLKKYNLYSRLSENKQIEIRPRCDYFSFISLLSHAHFVVSDGGSNQEECSFLGTPTLLLRKATERDDGLGKNVLLSELKMEKVTHFINNMETLRLPRQVTTKSATEIIVDFLFAKTS